MGDLWRWNGHRTRSGSRPLSTILPGNYRHLQYPQALDRPTLFLGDRSQEYTAPRRLFLGAHRS